MSLWASGISYCLTPAGFVEAFEWARRTVGHAGASLGLGEDEWFCVFAYTLHRWESEPGPFKLANGCLRFPEQYAAELEWLLPYTHLLAGALRKLPPFSGEVFRRVDLPEDVLEGARAGRFSDRAFLSCSEEPNLDTFPGKDMLVIHSRTGRSIAALSRYPQEREVVFLPETVFDVTQMVQRGQNTILRLTEA